MMRPFGGVVAWLKIPVIGIVTGLASDQAGWALEPGGRASEPGGRAPKPAGMEEKKTERSVPGTGEPAYKRLQGNKDFCLL